MLGVPSGSEMFWNRRYWTVRKGYIMWIWIQLTVNKNCMEILIKISTFNLPWNYLKLCEHQLLSLKKLKTRILNSESLSELKNSITEVNLKLCLKKIRFIEKAIYYNRNLHHLRMLKVFLSIVDNFNRHIFFVRQS